MRIPKFVSRSGARDYSWRKFPSSPRLHESLDTTCRQVVAGCPYLEIKQTVRARQQSCKLEFDELPVFYVLVDDKTKHEEPAEDTDHVYFTYFYCTVSRTPNLSKVFCGCQDITSTSPV